MTSMAEIQKKTITPTPSPTTTPTPSASKPNNSFLLACFGFSSQKSRRRSRRSKSAPLIRKEVNDIRDDDHEAHKIDIKVEHSTSSTSQRSWYLISWSSWRFRTNKSAAKTVPIDTSGTTVTTVTDKLKRPSKAVKFSSLQTKSKSKSGNVVSNSEKVLSATTDGEPPGTPSREEAEPLPIVSDPQTPINPNPPQAAPATPSAVTHSFSKQYSSWSWSTPVSNNAGSNNRGKAKAKEESTGANRKNLDPLVGMSIIMVTLIIMLVWGRLCAILCTSAWFYLLPLLRSAAADGFGYPHHDSISNVNTPRALDMNSDECKKKVVLKGFLERNHRNIIP